MVATLTRAGMKVNPDKTRILVTDSLPLLGYEVTPSEVRIPLARKQELVCFDHPRTTKELQRVLGSYN